MNISPEARERFLKEHSLDKRKKDVDADSNALRIAAERRTELVDKLLEEGWGRELWYDIIAEADVLKMNAMTGNSRSDYILGLQEIASRNMKWVKKFHFDRWLLMEQEAHNRRKEAEHARG